VNVTQATAKVEELLKAANLPGGPRVDVFVGEPTATLDSDGKAHAYLAIFPGPGQRDLAEKDLNGAAGARLWRFQVIAAGGDVDRCLKAVERATTTLVGASLDDTTSPVREDGDAGAVLKDKDVTPNRWYVPLLLAVEL
jgi:hypothetical protein